MMLPLAVLSKRGRQWINLHSWKKSWTTDRWTLAISPLKPVKTLTLVSECLWWCAIPAEAHEGPGDILCFLCGEEEIEKVCWEHQQLSGYANHFSLKSSHRVMVLATKINKGTWTVMNRRFDQQIPWDYTRLVLCGVPMGPHHCRPAQRLRGEPRTAITKNASLLDMLIYGWNMAWIKCWYIMMYDILYIWHMFHAYIYEGQLGYRRIVVVWIKNVKKNVILKCNIFEMWRKCFKNVKKCENM